MKVKMVRKAASVTEWERTDKREITESNAVIVKTITLSEAGFKDLCDGLLTDRKWITKNIDLMRCVGGTYYCIAATSEKSKIAVLIEAEGYDYARYAAVVEKEAI